MSGETGQCTVMPLFITVVVSVLLVAAVVRLVFTPFGGHSPSADVLQLDRLERQLAIVLARSGSLERPLPAAMQMGLEGSCVLWQTLSPTSAVTAWVHIDGVHPGTPLDDPHATHLAKVRWFHHEPGVPLTEHEQRAVQGPHNQAYKRCPR